MNDKRKERIAIIITRVYSVLNWIGAIASLLFAIILIVFSSSLASIVPEMGVKFGPAIFIFLGIILFVVGLLGIAVAWGLWKYKNWARILTLIFVGISFISTLIGLFKGFEVMQIVWLVIYALIVYLFGFYSPIVRLFYNPFLAKKSTRR